MAPQQNSLWMNQPWQVVSVDSGSGSLGVTDTVTFTTQNTITYQHSTSQTLNSPQSSNSSQFAQIWGTWNPSTVTTTRLAGYTSPGQTPFHIEYVNGQLKCYLDSPSPPRRFWAVILGMILGTSAGALGGVVAGFPAAVSALVALVASLPASLFAARIASPEGTTSTATWVANEGGMGGRETLPGPHIRKAVGA